MKMSRCIRLHRWRSMMMFTICLHTCHAEGCPSRRAMTCMTCFRLQESAALLLC